MAERVQIDRDDLDILLWFAKAGDVTRSRRRLRNWFRKVPICSGADREPNCPSCDTFTKAEQALKETP